LEKQLAELMKDFHFRLVLLGAALRIRQASFVFRFPSGTHF